MVKDPLPDALNLAETVVSNMERENVDLLPGVENNSRVDVVAPNSSVDRSNDAVRADEGNNGLGGCRNLKIRPNTSLMEPNSTARTYEVTILITHKGKSEVTFLWLTFIFL